MEPVGIGGEQDKVTPASRTAVGNGALDGEDGDLTDPVLDCPGGSWQAEHVPQPRENAPTNATRPGHDTHCPYVSEAV